MKYQRFEQHSALLVLILVCTMTLAVAGCGSDGGESETDSSQQSGSDSESDENSGGQSDESSQSQSATSDAGSSQSDSSDATGNEESQSPGSDTANSSQDDVDPDSTWGKIDLSDFETLLGKNMSEITPDQREQVAEAIRSADVDYAMTVDEFKDSIPRFEDGEKYRGKIVELTGVIKSFTRRTHLDGKLNPNVRFALKCMEAGDSRKANRTIDCNSVNLTPWLEFRPTQEVTVRGVCYASAAQFLSAAVVVDNNQVELPRYQANDLLKEYESDPAAQYDRLSEQPNFIALGEVATVNEEKPELVFVTDAGIEHVVKGGINEAVFEVEPGDQVEVLCLFSKFGSDDSNFMISTAYLLSINGEPVSE